MLEKITPVILTLNEAPNIRRCLESLRWAKDIVVVDSFSDDETVHIAREYRSVRVFQRKFDSHSAQWQFAISETGVESEWILALDADYLLTEPGLNEIKALSPLPGISGYRAHFVMCIYGKPLRSSIYPTVTLLYRRANARYVQDGHTQRIEVRGVVEDLRERVRHDDRKPLGEWLMAQKRYSKLEATKLLTGDVTSLPLSDRVRRMRFVAPLAMALYCLIWRRGILDGVPGIYYALQRIIAELFLSLYLLEHDLQRATASQARAANNDGHATEKE